MFDDIDFYFCIQFDNCKIFQIKKKFHILRSYWKFQNIQFKIDNLHIPTYLTGQQVCGLVRPIELVLVKNFRVRKGKSTWAIVCSENPKSKL